ncbi:hypothetical protein HYU11_00050 [Candidatus Woesearchaeota archaeon]|nr:hypothetical protein [Candidatus Woesearchaeota archaeon]
MTLKLLVPCNSGSIDAIVFSSPIGEASADLGAYSIRSSSTPSEVFDLDSALLKSELGDRFADYVRIPDWVETMLCVDLKRPYPPLEMEFYPVSSYTIQAKRSGYMPIRIFEAGVAVWLVTLDEQLVFGGLRSAQDNNGVIDQIGGVAEYTQGLRHPLFEAADSETLTEAGFKLNDPKIIGHYFESSFYNAHVFVFQGSLNARASEIIKLHSEAYVLYQELVRNGCSFNDARQALRGRGYPNVDAWEHSRMFIVPFSVEGIKSGLETYSHWIGPVALADSAVLMESMRISNG